MAKIGLKVLEPMINLARENGRFSMERMSKDDLQELGWNETPPTKTEREKRDLYKKKNFKKKVGNSQQTAKNP